MGSYVKREIMESTNSLSSGVSIRYSIRKDFPQLAVIEEQCFSEGRRWSEKAMITYAKKPNVIGIVATCDEVIAGCCFFALYPDRIIILNLAVHPDFQRRGIGGMLIQELWSRLNDKRSRLFALVPDGIDGAKEFFEHFSVPTELADPKGEVARKFVLSLADKLQLPPMERLSKLLLSEDVADATKAYTTSLVGNERYQRLIVCDEYHDSMIVAYALYEEQQNEIRIDGRFGIMVEPSFRRRGIGKIIMAHLATLRLPIRIHHISYAPSGTHLFLRALGVSMPEPPQYVEAVWKPSTLS